MSETREELPEHDSFYLFLLGDLSPWGWHRERIGFYQYSYLSKELMKLKELVPPAFVLKTKQSFVTEGKLIIINSWNFSMHSPLHLSKGRPEFYQSVLIHFPCNNLQNQNRGEGAITIVKIYTHSENYNLVSLGKSANCSINDYFLIF